MSGSNPKITSLNVDIDVDHIDITEKLTSTVTFDDVLKKCGDLGRFQWFHYILINLIAMSAGTIGFYYVFGAADPDHRCRLPVDVWQNDNQYDPTNSTYRLLIDTYVPWNNDSKTWEKCLRYDHFPHDRLVHCPNGWVYDRSTFGYTFTEEADLVCDRETVKSWLATLMQCGGLSLLFIGSFADRFGRKRITAIVTLLLFSVCFVTQILIQWIPMNVNTKFVLLLINQFASGLTASTFSLIFILLLELTSSAHTSFAGNMALVSFTIGEAIVTLFAYVARDWQLLKWLNTAFIGLVIPYLYFMPESPMFLFSKRRYHDLEALLRRIATMNGRDESTWYRTYQSFLSQQSTMTSSTQRITFFQQFRQIVTHRPTVLKLVIIAFLGFTTLMVYIKISYALAVMNISPYLGILIGAAVEAVGYVSGSLLINTRLARKGSFILMMILTIVCLALIPFLLKLNGTAAVFLAQFGKYSISGAIAVSWIFVPELFPTSIRSSANGFFIAFSRIGAIVAPVITAAVSADFLQYTYYGSAVLGLLVVFTTFLLPETKDKPMDDVQDYAHQ